MAGHPTKQDWEIRTRIYEYFVERARAPRYADMAEEFRISPAEARGAYRRLHDAHALLLEPYGDRIRILNPFSAIPTAYSVEVGDKQYFANCAWDMLGIPGMLGEDALIRARLEVVDKTVGIPVSDGTPQPDRDYIVNFSVPFRDWYADQIHT